MLSLRSFRMSKDWELYSDTDYETPIHGFWDVLGTEDDDR